MHNSHSSLQNIYIIIRAPQQPFGLGSVFGGLPPKKFCPATAVHSEIIHSDIVQSTTQKNYSGHAIFVYNEGVISGT